MSEFNPINTQEELDAVIGERLRRERQKYADYDDLKKTATEYETAKTKLKSYEEQVAKLNADLEAEKSNSGTSSKTIEELTKKVSDYEKDQLRIKVALDNGIPLNQRSRLVGDTEEELVADAKSFMEALGSQRKFAAPMSNSESDNEEDGITAAFKRLNPNIKI